MDEKYKKQRLKEVNEYIENKKKKEQRKEAVIKIIAVLIIILTTVAMVVINLFYLRYKYSHPELTQTQLMIWMRSEFWWYYILVFASLISGLYIKFKM